MKYPIVFALFSGFLSASGWAGNPLTTSGAAPLTRSAEEVYQEMPLEDQPILGLHYQIILHGGTASSRNLTPRTLREMDRGFLDQTPHIERLYGLAQMLSAVDHALDDPTIKDLSGAEAGNIIRMSADSRMATYLRDHKGRDIDHFVPRMSGCLSTYKANQDLSAYQNCLQGLVSLPELKDYILSVKESVLKKYDRKHQKPVATSVPLSQAKRGLFSKLFGG